MQTRRNFLYNTGALAVGSVLLPSFVNPSKKVKNIGVQLYTFRKEMLADAKGTLQKIAASGIKQIESAASEKGNYYGLSPKEMKTICSDLGMTLRSGHVHIDDRWQQTMNDAAESGQEYLICSTMATSGQTVANYKAVAEAFNKAGEECKKLHVRFGYHNHAYEFENENGKVLYDVLLENTDAALVNMEMDLGWVIVGGKDPLEYFKKYNGRFPLWHLKDMDLQKKQSTEFGKGGLAIQQMLQHSKAAGLKYFFVEQEEYTIGPFESMKENISFLNALVL
ncbi:sugar phosphate isomerase/epimerase family protein [Ferruginibacter sp. SUN106]|uniref:sugar phosphate isomerase/epimerase family protein n=1 Tax=Ferruginibacter sp. SUN106 TaxID=2978348 RepID=UPI003D3647EC